MDNYGQLWTTMDNYGQIGRYWVENPKLKDNHGRLWTTGSALQNRRVRLFILSRFDQPRNIEDLGCDTSNA